MAIDWTDAHGANDLTGFNSPVNAAALVGQGVLLDRASEQYAKRSSTASLSFADESFSLVQWVKFTTVTQLQTFISKWGGSNGSDEYTVYFGETADKLGFLVGDGTADPSVRVTDDVIGTLTTGVWYMIACVHDAAADEVRISTNAGTETIESYSGGCQSTGQDFLIGSANEALHWADYLMDQIGIWRKALNTSEISDLYNGGAGRAYSALAGLGLTTNLEAFWGLDSAPVVSNRQPRRLSLLGVGR